MTSVKILAVGDVYGKTGVDFLAKNLPRLKREMNIDFTVVNGENADNTGITPNDADDIFAYGADVITLGNHAFSRDSINNYLDDNRYILRPANLAPSAPGRGFGVFETKFGDVCVINLLGRVEMQPLSDNPFFELDRILARPEVAACRVKLVDFHAEATSEKYAMAFHAETRVSALWGTHTHVQTSDSQVFAGGLGYITDIGMTGAVRSILGVEPTLGLRRFIGSPKARFDAAPPPAKLEGCVFEIDAETGKCIKIEAIRKIYA
ncbi:MAG: YmdB family metallophosphoesterase [Oscillospiraceae bacterium]|jgi:metallophosphoesterase (TIGR00282 family)|nr:YmdB family metallophosphoesterase [Oscillospiraceae bacterium]